ncbi:hypothetical protein B0T17DRAFT_513932 [Bombardia bombarda]|uniref:Uncharacterized protein n=1 Tax=Bombardia bombarda TaxID=252184 RepID=A0AA39XII3_9PEZI|nr:hypothetical protein B0T17DRAFT_513932 [Bombardia bombarda]
MDDLVVLTHGRCAVADWIVVEVSRVPLFLFTYFSSGIHLIPTFPFSFIWFSTITHIPTFPSFFSSFFFSTITHTHFGGGFFICFLGIGWDIRCAFGENGRNTHAHGIGVTDS